MKPRYISIAGQERPLYFGFNALWRVEKKTGVPFSKVATLFEDISLETLLTLLDIALSEGARKDLVDYDLTVEQLTDALDEYGMTRFDEVIEALVSFLVPADGEAAEDAPGEETPAV